MNIYIIFSFRAYTQMILRATKCFCANFLSKVKEKNGRYFLEFLKNIYPKNKVFGLGLLDLEHMFMQIAK